ncbi:unnamed protein product [Closterium sp. NIES-54]
MPRTTLTPQMRREAVTVTVLNRKLAGARPTVGNRKREQFSGGFDVATTCTSGLRASHPHAKPVSVQCYRVTVNKSATRRRKTALSLVLLSLLAISQVACQKPNDNSAKYKFPPKITGAVEAVILGINIVNQTGQVTGDVNSAGRVSFALIKTNTSTFNIRYNVTIQVSSPEVPTMVTINNGAAKTSGPVVLDLSSSATWINVTGTIGAIATGNAWGQGARRFGIGAKPAAVPVYTYSFNGTWQNVSGLTAANGKRYKAVFESIAAKPTNFYAVVSSASLPAGVARGQFAKVPLGWGVWKNW